MTGTGIVRQGVEILRACGFVAFNFNSRRRLPVRGWVDVWAAKHGTSWLIEVKGEGDAVRPDQAELALALADHLGPGLRYVLARSVGDFMAIAEGLVSTETAPALTGGERG